MQLKIHATTVLCVRGTDKVAMASDGQVTLGEAIMKHSGRKVRRLCEGTVLAGFAGGAADGFALFSRFEEKLDEYQGNFERSAVELVKDWRTDRAFRHLEALLVVADEKRVFILSGNGDLIEPDDGIATIGSGGPMALAAARALVAHTSLEPGQVARESLLIAAGIDIYTNAEITLEELDAWSTT